MGRRIADEATFQRRLITALRDAEESSAYPANLSLHEAIEEIDLWVQDERGWRNTRGHNWASLLLDLDDAIEATGGALTAAGLEVARARASLKECAAVLGKSGDNSPDEDLRQRLRLHTEELRTAAGDARTFGFAFDALVDAASRGHHERGTARVLLGLVRTAGRDPKLVASQLCNLVHGKDSAVTEARQALADDGAGQCDELGLEARIDLARRWLGAPFELGDAVVWLALWSARIDPEPVAGVGPSVQLFDGPWMFEQVGLDAADRDDGLPAELTTQVEPDLESFLLSHQSSGDGLREPAIAFVRIAVADCVEAEVLQRARETAELLTGLASLHGASHNLWMLSDSYLMLADGATYHGTVPGALKGNPHPLNEVDLVRDRTLSILRSEATALGSKLPATDAQLQAAGKLLGWLRAAAGAPAPARLVLTDRVIEQVSGWAGISDRSRFTREYLQPVWAYNRIREEIVSATVEAVTAVRFSPGGEQKYFDILNNHDLGYKPGESIDLAGALRQIDWLLGLLPAGYPPERRLRVVRDRTIVGQATAAWWDQLASDFKRIDRRANRTRNALVHGGPIAGPTVDAVINFREAIARDAMAGATYALMRDVSPVDHFIGRRDRMVRRRQQLGDGVAPPIALFTDE
ncbi:MAG TPA: hypothetical protein VME22_23100 [Solirubrobacteraceae bacterium]|nr:hypothetical protein [Solirubrobacteraceae bacterium]